MNVDIRWKLRRHQTFSSTSTGPRFTLKPGMNKVDEKALGAVLAACQDRPTGISSYINSGDLEVLSREGEPQKPPHGFGDPNIETGLEAPPEDDLEEDDGVDPDDLEDAPDEDENDSTVTSDEDEDGDEPSGGLEQPPEGGELDPPEDEGDEIPETLDDYTVPGAAEVITDTFDTPTLEKWAEAEENGEARVGVAKAIAEQLALIAGAGDESTEG